MFHGSMVALVTPMYTDGIIDVDALRRLVEWHIQQQTDAIIVLGSTGEASTIHHAERKFIIENVLKQADRRVPVIAGTGTNSTEATIELTKEAMEIGVDACLLVTPYYNKPTQEGLYLHFKAIAEAVPIPQILYNVPSRTACDLKPATVARLSTISNIVGLKEATGNMERLQEILELVDTKLDLYSGDDATCLEFMLRGGRGVISVMANVAPRLFHNMCQAVLEADETKAQEINAQLMALYEVESVETNPIPVKWALHMMGMIQSGIRLPLTPLSEDYHQQMKKALEQVAILNNAQV